jgi:hypothetical protein
MSSLLPGAALETFGSISEFLSPVPLGYGRENGVLNSIVGIAEHMRKSLRMATGLKFR